MSGSRPADHRRARVGLALRLTEPLDPVEAGWIDRHLAGCGDCRDLDAAYRADQDALRALVPPSPPRDLSARMAAALDRADHRRVRGRRTPPRLREALVALVVVALVGWSVGTGLTGHEAVLAPGTGATATPINVVGGDVTWLTTSADGISTLNRAAVRQVCADATPTACTSIDANARSVTLPDVAPRSVYASPVRSQVVVVGRAVGTATLTLYVMDVGALTNATPVPSTPAPATPSATVAPSATLAPVATSTPAATSTPTPTTPASVTPASIETPTPTPTPIASGSPVAAGSATPSLAASLAPSPIPTASNVLAIASDLTVLGETAAYSPDGSWFAFTARPVSATVGSDIYAWRVGSPLALPITTDHRSVFSSWTAGLIVGSRAGSGTPMPSATPSPTPSLTPTPSPTPLPTPVTFPASGGVSAPTSPVPSPVVDIVPSAFLMDPATQAELDLPTPAWRPVVNPSGTLVAYWAGTVALDPATGTYTTASGSLVVGSWAVLEAGAVPVPAPSSALSGFAGPSPAPSEPATPSPTPTPSPSPSPTPIGTPAPAIVPSGGSGVTTSPTPSPSASGGATALPADVGSASGVPWDLQWDETGRHLAIWIGDPTTPAVGRLALVSVDPATGLLDPSGPSIRDSGVLPGVAIDQGHLAWATPPSPGGQGGRLVVYAWTGADPGRIDSQAAAGTTSVVVVQH